MLTNQYISLVEVTIVVLKINENRCKQTLVSLP